MGSIVNEPENIAIYSELLNNGQNLTTICLPVNKFTSKGVFYQTSPFDYSVPLLLAQLSMGCIVSLAVTRLLKRFGQPSMVTQMLAGLIIGPSLLGRIPGFLSLLYPLESMVMFDTLSFFAFTFFYFIVGVQLDPWIFTKIDKSDIKIGVTTVSIALILSMFGVAILKIGDFSLNPSISSSLPSVAIQSSVLSFPIIAQYLTEANMVNSDIGRATLGSSMVSYVCSPCIIASFVILSMEPSEVAWTFHRLFLIICFTIFVFLVVRPLIIWAMQRAQHEEQLNEGLIHLVLVGVLLTALLSKFLNVRLSLLPFLYGISIPAGPPLGSALVEKLDVIISWIFMPIYYAKHGLVVDISSVKLDNFMYTLSISLLAYVGKFLGAFLASIYVKFPVMEAVQIGLVMNIQGVLELNLLKLLKQGNMLNNDAFITTSVSMLLVTGLAAGILKSLYDPAKRRVARKRRLLDLAIESELRMVACVHDEDDVYGINNLITNIHPTESTPISIGIIHFIELVGRAHPILIPHKLTRVGSNKAPGSKNIINAFKLVQENYAEDAIQMHSYTAISSYTSMHNEVYEMAANRRASLIVIPFHKKYTNTGSIESSKQGIKIMNSNVLETSPCTTAILVNRSPISDSKIKQGSSLLHQVAVLFIGGRDDREALALGAKMAMQSNINLTVIRILEKAADAKDSSPATVWDNKAINMVKRQVRGIQSVVFREMVIEDATGTVDMIRAVENHFELIIIGMHHDEQSPLLHGLSDWIEEPELGILGDMFALPDHKSSSRILVIQHPIDDLSHEQQSVHHTLGPSSHNSMSIE